MAAAVADSYTAASGAVLYAGRVPPALSNRTALYGDSLTDVSYGELHPWTWANARNGGVLKFVANCGRAGDTTAAALARVDNLYTAVEPGLSGLGTLGRVLLCIGANDIRGDNSGVIDSGVKADYVSLVNAMLGYASQVVVYAVAPITGSGNNVQAFNAWLSSNFAGRSDVKVIDDNATVNNGSGGWASGYAPVDGIHYTNAGTYRKGLDGASGLEAVLAGFTGYDSPLSTDAADVYPAQPQWLQNPVMAGTGGSNAMAGGGAVATGWTVDGTAGLNATCSKVAADGGDSNQTPWQRVAPTQVTSGSGYILVNATVASASITTSYPDPDEGLDMMLEIRFNALDGAKFSEMSAILQGNNGEYLSPGWRLAMQDSPITGTVVARQALRRRGTLSSHSSASLQFYLRAASTSFTGAMGSYDFRCFTVRG